jgi:uncharacterized protein YecT (DUF1311 family)
VRASAQSLRALTFASAFALLAAANPAPAVDPYDVYAAIARAQPRGPSFDCKLAHLTSIERQICADPTLSSLDLELNNDYGEDAFAFWASDSMAVVTAQTAWLSARNACTTKACVRSAYEQRLATVQNELKIVHKSGQGRDKPIHASAALTAQLAKIARGCLKVDGTVDVGDGRHSLVAYACNECADNGGFYIFHPEAGTYRLLLHGEECYVSGLFEGFQAPRSHGYRRLVTFSRERAIEHSEVFFDYDGQTYRPTFELDSIYVDQNHGWITLTRIPH